MGPPRFDFTDLEDEDFELLCFLVVLLDFPDAERLRPPDHGADAGLEGTPGNYLRCWQFKSYSGIRNCSVELPSRLSRRGLSSNPLVLQGKQSRNVLDPVRPMIMNRETPVHG